MDYTEQTLETKEIFQGNIIKVESWKVKLPDGKVSSRDIIKHPGASVIIPLNENKELYLVRQYRKAIEQETLELPAGKLDNGEDPLSCAIRELKEETGLDAGEIKHVVSIHSTPGFCDEVLHMYLATDLREGEADADEDEFISAKKLSIDSLKNMILRGQITDAKTIIGILIADRIVNNDWDKK